MGRAAAKISGPLASRGSSGSRLARLAWLLIGSLAAGFLAAPVQSAAAEEAAVPKIYKWIDENGIAHYTTDLERIPRALDRRRVTSPKARPPALPAGPTAEAREPAFASAPSTVAAPTPEATSKVAGEAGPSTGTSMASPFRPGSEPSAPTATASAAPEPTNPVDAESWILSDRLPEQEFDIWAQEMWTEELLRAEAAEPTSGVLEDDSRSGAGTRLAAATGPDSSGATDLDARIAALEAEIAWDEEILKGFVGAPTGGGPGQLADDADFREVARRLPKRMADLRALLDQRAQLETP